MSEINYPIHGSCQCGNVRYQLLAPPSLVVACHCRECQKLSTSAFSITAMVKADTVKFEGEMQDWRRSADSGNTSAAKFCPTCGNRIYHVNPEQPDDIKLKPSNLSDTRVIQPMAHVWVSEKQDWYQIPEGMKTFDKQP
ncbi:aldehyde-activating protein [Thalassotalea insulae]|uniref:Aldehyde-activating protein n=1 Tax=Thalassotalea insulae TaxID=2056778 RepID=A0ABQ6GWT6_9GAMM|nr:GFA family protein [Thalassotalea insulae]GLX79082.1 aldehyde-activating protein [Thalassotalea insulae]